MTKIQHIVQENLKVLQPELGKGKSSSKVQAALDELHYLTSFNQNVSFAAGNPYSICQISLLFKWLTLPWYGQIHSWNTSSLE